LDKRGLHPLGTTLALDTEQGLRPALELELIYREHSAVVSKWVRRLWGTGRGAAAMDEEDLLHEVFLVVQRRIPTFRGDAALTTWLYSITVLVVNARRKKARWRNLLWRRAEPELLPEPVPPASAELGRAEASRVVYAVLDDLRERDRTLLILFELERLPGTEIAAILGMSEANLWVALSRARARFKRAFERRYGDKTDEGASRDEF
jgi:RNA polymerase sigma-70 factor, ECF subfamily